MADTIRCHACGGDMVRDTRPNQVEYKNQAMAFDQPGWYCQSCDEVVLDGPDAQVADEVFVRLRAEVDGLMTPGEVARVRKKLGLSQRQAGALLGGGPRSFQKYESGKDWVTRSMANLLLLLDDDPSGVDILAARTRGSGRSGTRNRGRSKSRSAAVPRRASGDKQ